MISPTHSNLYQTSSSSSVFRGDHNTPASQSSFHDEDVDTQHTSSSSLARSLSSGQSSTFNSPTQSNSSDERSIEDGPHLPKTQATKRDKLIGEAEKVVSKVIRDPELHERAILRAAGGKEAADGLAVIDSNVL
ncbi:unnamed protein product [Rhizoctonia solani]|uniref:Uncharacterized protein n=1 Tax=Rhizoctonia solani TaxID=456999 RepID=A0A8H3BAP6_9AGAM|nr:unnamed protein product [Rhizoctonia solani]CAE6517526.1 unnamed protein product [Rhizoctonia solani]